MCNVGYRYVDIYKEAYRICDEEKMEGYLSLKSRSRESLKQKVSRRVHESFKNLNPKTGVSIEKYLGLLWKELDSSNIGYEVALMSVNKVLKDE